MSRLRKLEAVTIASTAAAFALTVLLVTTGRAVEVNPFAAGLLDSYGWAAVGVFALAVEAAAFAYYERVRRRDDIDHRTLELVTLAGGGSLATLGLLDVFYNIYLLTLLDGLGSFHTERYAPVVAIVLVAGIVAFARNHVAKLELFQTLRKRDVRISLFFAFIIVISMSVGTVNFGGNDVDLSTGVVEAAGSYYEETYEDGTVEGWTNSGNTLTTESVGYYGSTSVHFDDPNDDTGTFKNTGNSADLTDYKVTYIMKTDTVAGGQGDIGLGDPDVEDAVSLKMKKSSNTFLFMVSDGGTKTKTAEFGSNQPGEWWNVTIYGSGGTHNLELNALESTKSYSKTITNSGVSNTANPLYQSVYSWDLWIDEMQMGDPTYTVSGTVKDKDGNSLSGASVTTDTGKSTTTDSNGAYSFSLKDGDYTITASETGYFDNSTTVSVAGSSVTGVDLTLKERVVAGRVTDQDGNGVANATYEIVGVDYSNITTGPGQTKAERADELIDQDTSAIPDSYDSELNIGGSDGFGANAACEYVAINSRNEWGLEKWTTGVDVGSPTVNPAAGRELVFSAWDPSYASGRTTFRDDADADNPGKTVKRDIKVERVDPVGDELRSNTIELDETRTVGVGPTSKDHAIGLRALPQGAFRVHVEGCQEAAYIIVVGSEGQLIKSFKTELEGADGAVSEAAQQAKDRLSSGKYIRITGTTDANGYYSEQITTPNVKRVAVTAYRIDGETLTTLQNPSPADMRAYVKNNDYNGSIAFSLEPRRYDVPNENANVGVRKFSSPPFAALDDFASAWGMMRDQVENQTFDDVGSIYSIPLDQWDKQQKEDGAKNLTKVLEENPELVDQWEDARGEDFDQFKQQLEDSQRTNEQLRNDIREMEKALANVKADLGSEEPDVVTDPGDQTVDFRQVYESDFTEDDVVVTWKDFSGSSTPISGEYVSVNKRPGAGDEVVVENYPIPNESAGGYVSVVVAGEDGGIGRGGERVENPNYSGTIPDLRSIDATTLQPGPNERVSLKPRFEQGANVTSISVRDDAGNTVASSLSNGKATFTPSTSGTHFVRFTFKSPDGSGPFVESVRLPVGNTSHAWPPGVYVRDGRSGVFTVAGDGVTDARTTVSSSGTELDVTALVDKGSGTNEVHYHLEDAPQSPDQKVTVRVIEGDSIDTGSSISRHVGAYIHGRELSADATIYRVGSGIDGEKTPIPHDGETNAGGLGTDTKGGTVIQTYTGANGETTVEIDNNPTRRGEWWYSTKVWWAQRGGILGMMAPAPTVDVASTVGTLPAWSVISLEPTAPTASTGAIVDATVAGPIQNAGAGITGAIA